MKVQLFEKEGKISTTGVFFAYKILKAYSDRRLKTMSFFKLAKFIKDTEPEADEKQLMYALMFLHSVGLMEIDGINLNIVSPEND